uniref:Venom polypeptide n=1 Tax=Dolopus genitalis TaxID=2488630 RepID=A0A3G5BII8_DOLGE|nr:venom polypeptide [Dolopus genitalis]
MKGFFTFIAFGAVLAFAAADFESEWAQFKVQYNRHYATPQEEAFRKELFRKTWEMVQEHNAKYVRGEVTWQMGINDFADWTSEEKKRLNGVISSYSFTFDAEWENFKNEYKRQYPNAEEEAYRRGIFTIAMENIRDHNKKFDKGEVTWKMGVNNFTDLTQNEFASTHLMRQKKLSEEQFRADWEDFKGKFGRQYENSVEEHFRRGIFRVKWEVIVQHNEKYNKGQVSWKMGSNNFTDWTGDEFSSHVMRPRPRSITLSEE